MKSMKSEDLSKDLQEIQGFHPKCQDFMMKWMKRVETKRLDLTQTQRSVFRSVFKLNTICKSQTVSGTDRDCVKGNHTVPTIKLTPRQSR